LEKGNVIRIYQLDGTLITTLIASDPQLLIRTENWSKGAYLVEIQNEKTRRVNLMVKE